MKLTSLTKALEELELLSDYVMERVSGLDPETRKFVSPPVRTLHRHIRFLQNEKRLELEPIVELTEVVEEPCLLQIGPCPLAEGCFGKGLWCYKHPLSVR